MFAEAHRKQNPGILFQMHVNEKQWFKYSFKLPPVKSCDVS